MSNTPKTALKILATSAIALFASFANASPIDELQQFNKSVSALSGSFTQKVMNKSYAVKKTSSGTFSFRRPGKFTWTYTRPYEQVLSSDGKTLTIVDKDLNQTTKRPLGSAIGSSPAAILFGGKDLKANFNLSDGGNANGLSWVTATPKSRNGGFTKINIGLANGVPDQMELYDSLGQITALYFSGVTRN